MDKNPIFKIERRVESFFIFYDEKLLRTSRFRRCKLAILTLKTNDGSAEFANGWADKNPILTRGGGGQKSYF